LFSKDGSNDYEKLDKDAKMEYTEDQDDYNSEELASEYFTIKNKLFQVNKKYQKNENDDNVVELKINVILIKSLEDF
jgi:hypothetical protein